MKWGIIGILSAICIAIGYMFSTKYKKRTNLFKTVVILCQKLNVEINFSRERLKKLFTSLDEPTKKNLLGIDRNFLNYLEGGELNDKTLFEGVNILDASEKEILLSFFKTLGRSDVDSQSKELSNYEKRFEEISQKCKEENKKYGSLSIKLGVVASLLIAVLLC